MSNGQTVTVSVDGGPTLEVPWFDGMNAQNALEGAYKSAPTEFTCGLQYFGSFGYLVEMVNYTYDTFSPQGQPNWYWEFLVNGQAAQVGIDGVLLNPGDVVGFTFTRYVPETHAGSLLEVKYRALAGS